MLDTTTKKYLSNIGQMGLKRYLTKHSSDHINFSSNDYLGLSQHQKLTELAIEYTKKYGAGTTGSRVLSGNMPYHEKLERDIANCYPPKKALIFASGFQANSTIISALTSEKLHSIKALVLADQHCHNSMITGCQLSKAKIYRYRHNDLEHLENLLKRNTIGPKFIMTETIFSMQGTTTNIADIVKLAKSYNAYTIIDDAHGIGVTGPDGYGNVKPYIRDIDMIIGTFSKALGSFGGYCICSDNLKDYLVNTCRGFIYTTAPSPAMVGAMQAAWSLIPTLGEFRVKLSNNARKVKSILDKAGWSYGNTSNHIIPVYNCGDITVMNVHKYLLDNNIVASYIRPPTTPNIMLRLTISAQHSEVDMNKLSQAIEYISLLNGRTI